MRIAAQVLEMSIIAYVVLLLSAIYSFGLTDAWPLYAILTCIAVWELYAAYVTLRRGYEPDFGLLKGVRHTRPTGIYALYVGVSVLSVECLILIGVAIRPLPIVELAEIAVLFAAILYLIFSLPSRRER
jgi:hypothetical protein